MQHEEKLIPLTIKKCLTLDKIPIYGKGLNIRDWLYVEDHCQALSQVLKDGILGNTYNIGGGCELTNISIVSKICNFLDKIKPRADEKPYIDQICYVKDRPGHDFRYAINFDKIKKEIGWTPRVKIDKGLTTTIKWYINNMQLN